MTPPTFVPAPKVGDTVHYLSHGSPVLKDGTQVYRSECRAATVTEVSDKPGPVGLVVLNPGGMFFRELAAGGALFDQLRSIGGTWHWPHA